MTADVFLDTNILLYAIDEEPASALKRQRAYPLSTSRPPCFGPPSPCRIAIN